MRERSEAVQVSHSQANKVHDGGREEVSEKTAEEVHEVIRLDTANCKWKKKVGAAILAWGRRTDEELRQFQAEQKRRHLSLVHSAGERGLQTDQGMTDF